MSSTTFAAEVFDRRSSSVGEPSPRWQDELKAAIRTAAELCRLLDLPADWARQAEQAAKTFPLLVPQPFLARMRRGDPADPLLRQVLPLDTETITQQGFSDDPVGDLAAEVQPGLLHKYHGRALMVTTGACAVHCRYCFRRHFPYWEAPKSLAQWEPVLEAISRDESITEVILSGGDPLVLTDVHLAALALRLADILHVKRVRVHTRLPIVIPSRVTDELLAWLTGTRLAPILVVHANHPAEIDAGVAAALGRLSDAGIPLLNQAVLLRGVNDDTDTLAALSERLVNLRVMPYYLHLLDRVTGGAHFEVPLERGQQMIAELQARLPGYAVPKLVREMPGAASKVAMV